MSCRIGGSLAPSMFPCTGKPYKTFFPLISGFCSLCKAAFAADHIQTGVASLRRGLCSRVKLLLDLQTLSDNSAVKSFTFRSSDVAHTGASQATFFDHWQSMVTCSFCTFRQLLALVHLGNLLLSRVHSESIFISLFPLQNGAICLALKGGICFHAVVSLPAKPSAFHPL